ncbi:MAG: TonB-dependent receptor plug domain-containing protein [Massilibacteroides sp.]|nr:TonB-dependent receptor plug domain-containing protein [Massilibacteroides sp.]
MNNIKLFLILLLSSFLTNLQSQDKANDSTLSFNGLLIDNTTGKPIDAAVITLTERQLWAISDQEGSFSIPGLQAGTYKYAVTHISYQKHEGTITINRYSKKVEIRIDPQSLALDEVTVTAKESRMTSSSVIGKTAIQHIQPKSVEDMLQLVPGNLTQNPSLSSVGQAYIRDFSKNANNAMGTTILVDGAPLSNDANLQVLSTARSGIRLSENESSSGLYQTTAGRGSDLRTISPDNIESVEVIRGVAGVEYGNLTSGAMIIKTKAGVTPLEVKAKTDEFSKMFYGGKGFSLGGERGSVNLSLDYTQSYADIRKKYEGYERITSNIGYSNVFMKQNAPLSLNARLAYFRHLNSNKSDPQLKMEERISNKNQGLRFTLEGNWRLNNRFISNLTYSFMINHSHQEDYEKRFTVLHTGITPIAESLVDGEFESRYLNASYYSERLIDGKPLSIFGQIKSNKLISFSENSFMNLKLGVEWKHDSNNGDGLSFDPLYPPVINSVQTIRPRSYKSIPAMNLFSFFIEDKLQMPIQKTQLTLMGGVRLSHFEIDKSARKDDIFKVEPRINVEYRILDQSNNALFDNLSIVGGFGILVKMPPLLYLYPDKTYFDESSMTYMSPDLSKGLAIMTTKVIEDTSNPNLKPSVSNKFEIGLAAVIGKMTGNMTFFHERIQDEYGFRTIPYITSFQTYSIPIPDSGSPSISDFYYKGGTVYYTQGGTEYVAKAQEQKNLRSYSSPDNGVEAFKTGIEYSFNLGQIPVLKTSVVVDGAWLYVKRKQTENYYKNLITTLGTDYPYMPLMPAGHGSVDTRINTNFRFITHIPKLKMIFSTTAQVVWRETFQSIYEDENGNPLYYKTVDPQSGNDELKAYVNPVGFLDKNGQYQKWMSEYYDNYTYRRMLNSYGHSNYFEKEILPTTILLNFRLTKEFGHLLDFSFIANNFLNISKKYKYKTQQGYTNLMIPLYFGAEITIKI